ncbi:hypothetical protein BOW86_gp116 [Synechococcus phage S-CAM7]|nr:hypothetical protein BOW86_gp116 [Synechococcus phage S-CAM7]AOV62040.1 hypothetical protein C490910_116 [Synechococcus phage S-CAM7]
MVYNSFIPNKATQMDPISFAIGMVGAALVGIVNAELIKANNKD